MKLARLKETFPQAELRRLKQAKRQATHRAAETPELSQDRRRQQAEHLNGLRRHPNKLNSQARRLQHFSRRITRHLK